MTATASRFGRRRAGQRSTRERGGGAAVGDGAREPPGGRRRREVGEQVAGQRRSPAPTVLRSAIGGGVARQAPLVGDEHRTRGAERRQHGADRRARRACLAAWAAASGRPRRRPPRARSVGAGQLGELLGVRLEQIGARPGRTGGEREQRGAGGVDRDPAPARRRPATSVAYQSVGTPGGSEPDSTTQRRGRRPSSMQRVGRACAGLGRQGDAGFVDLGGGAVGLGDGDVGARRPGRPARCRGGTIPARMSAEQSGSSSLAGSTATAATPAGGDRAGDVDALAARIASGRGRARCTAPRSSGPARVDGAVDARVGGQRDDHAITTSMSAARGVRRGRRC